MAGRPKKWKTAKELQDKCWEYLEYCQNEDLPPNKAGLALHLDTTRDVLADYENGKHDSESEQYSHALKKVYLSIENWWICALASKKQNTAGIIFYMKNAFGYTDKQDVEHSGEISWEVVNYDKEANSS